MAAGVDRVGCNAGQYTPDAHSGGRFSRRIRGYGKANGLPVVDCSVGERKHDIADEYLAKTKVTQGLFLILVGRAQAPVWDIGADAADARREHGTNGGGTGPISSGLDRLFREVRNAGVGRS